MSRLRLHHSRGTGRCRPAAGGTRRPPRVVPGPQDPGASHRGCPATRLQGRCPGRIEPALRRRLVVAGSDGTQGRPAAHQERPRRSTGSRPASCWRAGCGSIAWAGGGRAGEGCWLAQPPAGPGRRCRRGHGRAGGSCRWCCRTPEARLVVRRCLRTRVLDAGEWLKGVPAWVTADTVVSGQLPRLHEIRGTDQAGCCISPSR
jgi:hypothetical protein